MPDDSDDDDFHSAQSGSDSDDALPRFLRPRAQDHPRKRPKLRHSPHLRLNLNRQDERPVAPEPVNLVRRKPLPTHATILDTPRPLPQAAKRDADITFKSINPAFLSNDTFDDPQPPPYYYDTKLDVEMYRGPGYERFPVALGTVEGHREICDKWKRKGRGIHLTLSQLGDDSTHPPDEDEALCIQRVVDVFPDIQLDFVLQKIRDPSTQLNFNDEEIDEHVVPARIIAQVLEMDNYPKATLSASGQSLKSAPTDETGVTVLYNKNNSKDATYLKEAIIILAQQFEHVPTHFISKIVHENRALFASFIYLQEAERDYYTKPHRRYIRHRQARANLEKKYARLPHEQRNEEKYAQIVNELQAAKQHVAREEMKASKQKEKEEAEATNLAIHKASGSLIECQCCFDDEIPMNRAIGCQADEDIHFFCYDCVTRLAENQIGMMKWEMLCMDGSGCKASLSAGGIAQAVSTKTFDKLAFNQQQAEIAAAGIEGLEQCPYCDFKGICEPVELDRVFNCQNPDCGRATCRLCKLDAHVPKSCEEMKADKKLDARHRIEEARSDKVMRKCPKCAVPIIKELGCNKMICTNCRCIICYECKADISKGKEGGYEHFNKSGSKCKLYDTPGVDRHEVEADEAEKEAIKKATAEDAELDEKQLQIETGRKKKPKTVQQPPPGLAQQAPDPLLMQHLLAQGRVHVPRLADYYDGALQGAGAQAQMAQQQQGLAARMADAQRRMNEAHEAQARQMADMQRRVNEAHANAQAIHQQMANRNQGGLHGRPQQQAQPRNGALQPNNPAPAAGHQAQGNWPGQNNDYLAFGYPPPGYYNLGFDAPQAPAAGLNQDFEAFNNAGLLLNPWGAQDFPDFQFADNDFNLIQHVFGEQQNQFQPRN